MAMACSEATKHSDPRFRTRENHAEGTRSFEVKNTLTKRRDPLTAHNWVRLNVFPSGSLNHATLAPLGELQMPSLSCCIPG